MTLSDLLSKSIISKSPTMPAGRQIQIPHFKIQNLEFDIKNSNL